MTSCSPFADRMLQWHGPVPMLPRSFLNPATSYESSSGGAVVNLLSYVPSSSKFSNCLLRLQGIRPLPCLRARSLIVSQTPKTLDLNKVASSFSSGQGRCCYCCSSSSQAEALPLLMVPHDDDDYNADDDDEENDYIHFFNIVKQKEFRIRKIDPRLPWIREFLIPDDAVPVGSSHGWLGFVHPRTCYPYLFNPFLLSSAGGGGGHGHLPYVPLPPYENLYPGIQAARLHKSDIVSPSPCLIKDFVYGRPENSQNESSESASNDFILKFAMSSAPSLPCLSYPKKDDHCTVMVITSSNALFCCKPGDERWTDLTYFEESSIGDYEEIAYFSKDQRFYAMCYPELIAAWDLSDHSSPKCAVIRPSFPPIKFLETCRTVMSYLVESSGDLLLVYRVISRDADENGNLYIVGSDDLDKFDEHGSFLAFFYRTVRFHVYKLDFDQNKWVPVECLGERAVFVGCNHSFSVSTRDYPRDDQLMENSIYFTNHIRDSGEHDSNPYWGHDNGVFHLKDNSITPFFPGNRLKRIQPPPIWVAPTTS